MDYISLFNFDIHNDITINHPLLYLHGSVVSREEEVISCVNKTLINQESELWPIKEGQFKVFVFLGEGENEVVLTVGASKVLINASYVKKQNCRYVLPIYIICKNSDGSFMAPPNVPNSVKDAITKIQLNARLIQTYFAESLYDQGFKRKTFNYHEDEEKRPLVKIVNSDIDIEQIKEMTRDDLYDSFRKELKKLLPDDPCRKLLVFMSCTRYNPPEDETQFSIAKIQSYATGHAALGGGDMALFGTGSLHTWASTLSELNAKFSDLTEIDRMKLFDDSCGRGTYMANYSTTLGATVHELGHAFDLAHTPHGIMCRGHDDMNFFFSVVKPCSVSKELMESSCHLTDDSCKYKGAHWYRSSAVILNFQKWFNPLSSSESVLPITKSLHPNLLGPVGNIGSWYQKDQVSFNSQSWLNETGLDLLGVVFFHDKYLYGLQFIGSKYELVDGALQCHGEPKFSETFGTSPESATKTTFHLNEPDEKIIEVKVRSGAYVDGIEITTNKKCSGWIGGDGGDLTVYQIGNDQSIQACVGTAGKYVGSVGFILNSSPNMSVRKGFVSFSSDNGIRLLETYAENGEVKTFEEYLDDSPPKTITKRLFGCADEREKVVGMIYDNAGEKLSFAINDFEIDLISELP